MANGVTKIPDGLNRIGNHATMVPGMIERIKACADAGLPNVICFSGNRAGMDDELGLANCATALKQIVGEAERRRVTAVSYTHLDVYKRQDYSRAPSCYAEPVKSPAVQAARVRRSESGVEFATFATFSTMIG